MSKITKRITFIVLLITSMCFSQNDCVDFKDYEESQEWIKRVNLLNPIEKKNEILKWVKCETNINEKLNCTFLYVINNRIISSNSFSRKTIEVLELIPSEKFILKDNGIESCRCILGGLIINVQKDPIINEIKNITFKSIIRKKNKIKIRLFSNEKSELNLNIEPFIYIYSNFENRKIKLKKGKNKIKIKTDNELKIIELEQDNLKSIIIQ